MLTCPRWTVTFPTDILDNFVVHGGRDEGEEIRLMQHSSPKCTGSLFGASGGEQTGLEEKIGPRPALNVFLHCFTRTDHSQASNDITVEADLALAQFPHN